MLVAATAIVATVFPVVRRSLQGARPLPFRRDPEPRETQRPLLVGAETPVLVGADVEGSERRERPGRPDGDQGSRLSRPGQQRRSLVQPNAGRMEDASQMERQVRDQLYGPGFRRR